MKKIILILIVLALSGCSMIPKSCELTEEDKKTILLPEDIEGIKLEDYTFKKYKNGKEYALLKSKSLFSNDLVTGYSFVLIDNEGKERGDKFSITEAIKTLGGK